MQSMTRLSPGAPVCRFESGCAKKTAKLLAVIGWRVGPGRAAAALGLLQKIFIGDGDAAEQGADNAEEPLVGAADVHAGYGRRAVL